MTVSDFEEERKALEKGRVAAQPKPLPSPTPLVAPWGAQDEVPTQRGRRAPRSGIPAFTPLCPVGLRCLARLPAASRMCPLRLAAWPCFCSALLRSSEAGDGWLIFGFPA